MPSVVSAVCPSMAGGFVLLLEDGFWRADSQLRNPERVALVHQANGDLRMNDGKIDPAGRFWGGSTAYDESPGAGSLYVLEGAVVTRVLTGLGISNGLDWSPDGTHFYFVDSLTRRLSVFDYDPASARISRRKTLVDFDESFGLPDGLTVDAEGCIWVAGWGGWKVQRYSADGKPLGFVNVPAAQVTNCAFGGEDLMDLYITTAREGQTEDQLALQPEAGSVLSNGCKSEGESPSASARANSRGPCEATLERRATSTPEGVGGGVDALDGHNRDLTGPPQDTRIEAELCPLACSFDTA